MDYQSIPPIPDIPDKIITAIEENRLAVFLGAGVSRLVGCSGWDELAKELVNICYSKKNNNGEPLISFREKEKLLYETDHRKTITIAYKLLEKGDHKESFYDLMEKALKFGKDREKIEEDILFRELLRLNAVYLTTNADLLFDQFFIEDRIFYNFKDLEISRLGHQKLFHLHGVINHRDTMVFTLRQYFKRYKKPNRDNIIPNEGTFIDFLSHIFDTYTVLFLGYGLNELEILEYLFTQIGI
jgi:hypothetical protein